MKSLTPLLAVTVACVTSFATSGAVHAQDLFGFDRGSFGNVVLNRNQSAGGEIELELAVGSYNNESIRNYSPDSVFARMGQAVGRLDILTDKGVFPCTAFIVSDKHILTNHHCVPGILGNEKAGATRIDAVQFVAGYTQQGVDEGTRKYTVIPVPVETSKELDYSVLEVLGDPSEVYGKLALSDREPRDGDPYWVIGHPMGEAQRISREKCKANTPALSQSRLLHTCDTLPGNSGSPVIDASLQRVIGLHHAGSKRDSVNFAIPMREILSQSTLLAALVQPEAAIRTDAVAGGGGGGVAADAGTCDAFYNEAKALGQCFAYEAYVESCASHPYIRFAQGYLKSNCAAPPADAPVDVASAPKTPEALLRPWCGSSRMNLTERTICDTPALADLDAEMEAAYYGQSGRATSAQQNAWRTGTRDACGADTNCIYRAVSERITYLRSPNAPVMRLASAPSDQYTEQALQLSHGQRVSIQGRLNAIGINVGGADGSFGPMTRRGISAWQAQVGAPVSGYFNEVQYQTLLANTEERYQAWLASRPKPQPKVVQKRPSSSADADAAAAAIAGAIFGAILSNR
jgi:V8-like Glu-specific endopeptidase/uncharacterized protein